MGQAGSIPCIALIMLWSDVAGQPGPVCIIPLQLSNIPPNIPCEYTSVSVLYTHTCEASLQLAAYMSLLHMPLGEPKFYFKS